MITLCVILIDPAKSLIGELHIQHCIMNEPIVVLSLNLGRDTKNLIASKKP